MEERESFEQYGDLNIEYVDAIYTTEPIPEYQGNPLIEALPPIFTEDEVMEALTSLPPYSSKERDLNPAYRVHCVQRVYQYFQPFYHHIDLEGRISRAIRQGYLSRNPLTKDHIAWVRESYKSLKTKRFLTEYKTSTKKRTATGFTIVGVSGVGKSTAIERITSYYPRVIYHTEYNNEPFHFTQIPYLHIDCPHNGSLKGLCFEFFMELDNRLGTNYMGKYGKLKNTIDLMLQYMAHLTRVHGIGILIIDEIQHLAPSTKGSADEMLNLFVTLVNIIGTPVILVGTSKAVKILQGEFRQARRGSGQGDMEWNIMPKDGMWDLFLEGLWGYQWTANTTPLTAELNSIMHDESQGITDIVVKLFILAQVRAIATGEEKISVKLIKEVSKEHLKLVKPMLEALKSGIPSMIQKYGDIATINLEEELIKYNESIDMQEKIRVQKKLEAEKRSRKRLSLLEDVMINLAFLQYPTKDIEKAFNMVAETMDLATSDPDVLSKETINLLLNDAKREPEKPKPKPNPANKSILGKLLQDARKNKSSAYDWFKKNQIVKNPQFEPWRDDDGEMASSISGSLS